MRQVEPAMITNTWLRVIAWSAGLLAAAAAILVIQMVYEPVLQPILEVLLPFSAAVALALLLNPTIERLSRRGLSRGLATGLVALLFVLAFVVLGVFLIPVLVNQALELAKNLPNYFDQAQSYVSSFMASHQALLRRFQLPTTVQDISSRFSSQIRQAAAASLSHIGGLLAGVLSKAIWLVIIPIVTILLLIDLDRVKAKALLLVPEPKRDRTAELAGSVGRVFGAYIRGLLTVAILYGIVVGMALTILRVPYAAVLGAAAGALSLVPYIGTISTVILVALIALVSGTPAHAVWAAITVIIVNQVFDNAISPNVVGKAVGLHPALAILALLLGAKLFGIVGMILAVPVAASIQILVLEFYPPLKGPSRQSEEKPRRPSLFSRLIRRQRQESELTASKHFSQPQARDGQSFYFYENWVAKGHTAVIHRATCRFCNDGRGVHPGAGNANGAWSSSAFDTLEDARSAAEAKGAKASNCSFCLRGVI